MTSNERLRAALISNSMSTAELAGVLEVDPKTVERWVATGRVPHRTHRLKAAAALQGDDTYLWPSTADDDQTLTASQAEAVQVFQNRGAVPHQLWLDQLTAATEAIDFLAFAATFLHDALPEAVELLRERMDAGVQVRLLLGDPDSEAVARRGEEEGIGRGLRSRCELTWTYFAPLLSHPGMSARRHGSTLYASLFRFDDDLLANHHLFGAPASQAPVTQLRRVPGARLFLNHMQSFERVWDQATPFTG